jgi:hypothetical protein
MKPLNKKTRSQKLFHFLVLFIGGILIVMIPFYFIIRLPAKENAVRAEEFNSLEGQLTFQKNYFSVQMDSANHMLARYGTPGIDVDKLNGTMGLLLSDMEKQIGTENVWTTAMYRNIIGLIVEMKQARNDILRKDAEIAKLTADLAECTEELEKTSKELKEATGGKGDSLEH